MAWFGLKTLDLAEGQLPPWLDQFVTITRPLATSALIAIPSIGAFTVGLVSFWDAAAGEAAAKNSVAFLAGIPDAAYTLIGAVALGYFGAKTAEVIKKPAPPSGDTPPETGQNTSEAVVTASSGPVVASQELGASPFTPHQPEQLDPENQR